MTDYEKKKNLDGAVESDGFQSIGPNRYDNEQGGIQLFSGGGSSDVGNNNSNWYKTNSSEPIPVNQTGITQGNYGQYEYGSLPSYESPYAEQLRGVLDKINNYGDYNSQYADQLKTGLEKLLNWQYDPESDASYQAYKNQYTRGGKQAMADTLAQASALTGGFGSSYGQTAAQQTYNNYMAELADKIPELSQLAYQMAANKYGLLVDADNTDYSRWNDKKNDLYNQYDLWKSEDSDNYNRWNDEYNNYMNLWDALYNIKSSGGSGGGSGKESNDPIYNDAGYGSWNVGYGDANAVDNEGNPANMNAEKKATRDYLKDQVVYDTWDYYDGKLRHKLVYGDGRVEYTNAK